MQAKRAARAGVGVHAAAGDTDNGGTVQKKTQKQGTRDGDGGGEVKGARRALTMYRV